MKRVSRQHEATYSEVKRLLMELPFYWLNSNLNNLNGRFVGGTVNANQTIQITGVSDSWSKNYVLFTGRSGSMGSMYYRDFEGITPIIGNPDINVYLDAGYLYIRNNGGVTIQYGIIKIQ